MLNDPKLRDWRRHVGETGDLADIIAVTLSLASTRHGVSKIRLNDFYRQFGRLATKFPEVIPELHMTSIAGFAYSRPLGEALEEALRLGPDIANPRFQYIVVQPNDGTRNLERIRKRAGQLFIDKLQPVAADLAAAANETDV
jgi:hypothetical protein